MNFFKLDIFSGELTGGSKYYSENLHEICMRIKIAILAAPKIDKVFDVY